jgi:hypothetical protein
MSPTDAPVTPGNAAAFWRVLRIIHLAFAATIGVYAVVVAQVTARAAAGAASAARPFPTPMAIALAAVSVAMLVIGIPLARAKLMPPRQRVDDGRARTLGDLDTPGGKAALEKVFIASIVSWALCGAVAIYGLVLSLLTMSFAPFVPFGAVALAAMLALTPRAALWQSVARGLDHAA